MNKEAARTRRKMKIRKMISGTAERPRVYLNISNRYLYVAVTNDDAGKVLASAKADAKNMKSAGELGKTFAKKANELGVKKVVFDRSGYKYHGKVKALADALREGGLDF